MLVEKTPAGRADALNCGMNLARFRYTAVVDAGVVFEPDALLRAMSAPLQDPAHVVAAASHVEARRELRHREITGAQPIEDRAPRRIGDGEKSISVSGGTGHGVDG